MIENHNRSIIELLMKGIEHELRARAVRNGNNPDLWESTIVSRALHEALKVARNE